MGYNIQGNDLTVLTQSVKPSKLTLWDYLPKIKSDTAAFTYTKRDQNIRKLPDTASAGGARPSTIASHLSAIPGITKEHQGGAWLSSAQMASLGTRANAEKEYLTTEVKTGILIDRDLLDLFPTYGAITTSGSYGHSGASWASSSTLGAQMNQMATDCNTVKAAMFGNIGEEPNVVMVNRKGYNAFMTAFLDSGNYKDEYFTTMIVDGKLIIPRFMGMDIWVVDATYNTGSAFTSVWGDYAWFMYIEKSPSTVTGSTGFGFVVESGAGSGSDPWSTEVVEKTEVGKNWYLETKYQAAFAETNLKALYRLDSSSSGDLY